MDNKALPVAVLVLSLGLTAAGQSTLPQTTIQIVPQSPSSSQGKRADVSVVGCLDNDSGRLRLTDEDGNIYYLTGHTAGLRKQVGDQLSISGTEKSPPIPHGLYSQPYTTLEVVSVKSLLQMNPAGVPPVLGDPAQWSSVKDDAYGLSIRFPKTFQPLKGTNFGVAPDFVNDNPAPQLQSREVPQATFPNTNFVGGSFTAFVNPTIRSAGTCMQFSSFWPKYMSSFTVHGIKYAQTRVVNGSAGSVSDEYHLHTFQNGLCYELVLEFFEENSTGMALPCKVQWILDQNKRDLMNSLLPQVSFITPKIKIVREPRQTRRPAVTSLTSSPITFDSLENVSVSWSSRGADYVQLLYRCTRGLAILGPDGAEEMKCGEPAPHNFHPAGSASFVLLPKSSNPSQVTFALTVEPFSNGVGYPKQSKTINIPVLPRPKTK